jgi:hypothetical protein
MNRATRLLLVVSAIFAGAACEASGRDPLDTPPQKDASTKGSAKDGAAPASEAGEDDAGDGEDAETLEGGDAKLDAVADGGGDTGITDSSAPTAPTVDGVISAGEYGVQTDGQNQQTTDAGTTWTMTWTDAGLYVGIATANLNEAAVLYVGPGAVAASAGSASDGTPSGYQYDNTKVTSLPFRAGFVAYFKSGYHEYRIWDGVSAWGAAYTSGVSYAESGNVREIAIPWTDISAAGRPASFAWAGYVTSSGGYVYGQMPPDDPGASIGLTATFPYAYQVADTTLGTGTKPFAVRVP